MTRLFCDATAFIVILLVFFFSFGRWRFMHPNAKSFLSVSLCHTWHVTLFFWVALFSLSSAVAEIKYKIVKCKCYYSICTACVRKNAHRSFYSLFFRAAAILYTFFVCFNMREQMHNDEKIAERKIHVKQRRNRQIFCFYI